MTPLLWKFSENSFDIRFGTLTRPLLQSYNYWCMVSMAMSKIVAYKTEKWSGEVINVIIIS